MRKQALYHTVVEPNRGGAGLSDSVVHLKALQTSTQILSLKLKKTNGEYLLLHNLFLNAHLYGKNIF